VIGNMAYGALLIWIEKHVARIRNSMFLNLILTYPVNIALSVYIYFFTVSQYPAINRPLAILAVAAFVMAFLHYEIGRKTFWPHHADQAKRHYSAEIGGLAAGILALVCAATAVAVTLLIVKPWELSGGLAWSGWAVTLPLLPAALGARRYFSIRYKVEPVSANAVMIPYAMGFLFLFYLVIFIHAIFAVAAFTLPAASVILVPAAWAVAVFFYSHGGARGARRIGRIGSIYIHATEEFIQGNDMIVTARTKEPIDLEKMVRAYDRLIRENPTLQCKWVWLEKEQAYGWEHLNPYELEAMLTVEKERILRYHDREALFSEYFPTNRHLPIRIYMIDPYHGVTAVNHVFSNGVGVMAWCDTLLRYYLHETGVEITADHPYHFHFSAMQKCLIYIRSIFWALVHTIRFAQKAAQTSGAGTVDLTHGKVPARHQSGYSVKTYRFSEVETQAVVKRSKGLNITVAQYMCGVFTRAFFDAVPEAYRVCISSPVELRPVLTGVTFETPGNFTGSLIFQVFRDKDIEKQVYAAFKNFRRGVPLGVSKLLSIFIGRHKALEKMFAGAAALPIPERAPFENFTFAFSAVGLVKFPALQALGVECSGHTRTQTIFIAPVTLNGRMTIEISCPNDLFDAREVFGVTDQAVKKLKAENDHRQP
jgi:hypothetical protein